MGGVFHQAALLLALRLCRVTMPLKVPLDTRASVSFSADTNIAVAWFQKFCENFV